MSQDDSLEGLDGLLQSAWTDNEPQAPGERAGDRIDRYKLYEEIGEGGMGSVWMAEQKEPVKRKVALKIIKLGMDTNEVVVRFEAERQALALMDHPHIAKVLDGGATESGRPYFVMELVRGTPITDYCDAAKAGLRERLELFTKVCAAVQHAHQKGIIHRDLKPGNVLVTLHDGVPVPKVIDFGIAKATSAELTQKTMFTQHAQILGTPEYMAPEQAEMSGLDIDTRADVYSLGVLLYELLTGTKPFDIRGVLEKGYHELLRTIREDEPAKPSTRVSTLGEDASPIATGRQVDVETLSKHLRGDLDWVVMKALEKDRTRRYETATGFAADIERYLREEPVTAAPPSARYRLRKFVRRRKKTVVAAGLISFLLIAGSVGTGIGWWNTQQANAKLGAALTEKDAALLEEERQRELAEENETRARTAEAAAEKRAAELEQVAVFQSTQLIELDPGLMGIRLRRSLIDAVPEGRREALSRKLSGINFTNLALQSLEENLFERTFEAVDAQFAEQPVVQALLFEALGKTLMSLGLLELANDPHQRALSLRRTVLGEEHPDTLRILSNIGILLLNQWRIDEARLYLQQALDARRRVLGNQHRQTLLSILNMGSLLERQERYPEAERYYREALDGYRRVLGDDDPATLGAINTMGSFLLVRGRHDEAERCFREALDGRRRVLGDEHSETITSINNLGSILFFGARLDEAEPYTLEALDTNRRVLGDEHPHTLMSVNNVATLRDAQGRVDEAELYYREVLDTGRRVLGDEHLCTSGAMVNFGSMLTQVGRLDDAEPYLREGVKYTARIFGEDHARTLGAIEELRLLFVAQATRARQRGAEEHLASALADLGALHLSRGNDVAAGPVLAEAFEILSATDADESLVRRVQSDLGATIALGGSYVEAEPLLEESAVWMLRHPDDPAAGTALQQVVDLYDAWHAAEPGRGYDRLAAAWRRDFEAWSAERDTE